MILIKSRYLFKYLSCLVTESSLKSKEDLAPSVRFPRINIQKTPELHAAETMFLVGKIMVGMVLPEYYPWSIKTKP